MTPARKASHSLAERIRKVDKGTWGTILIISGVAAWLPFFYLLSIGREVSIYPFLAAHLAGVLAGAWLRSRGGRDVNPADHKLRLASRILIYLGVLAWAPYFYLTRVAGLETAITPFLAAHLTGVLSGIGLRVYLQFKPA